MAAGSTESDDILRGMSDNPALVWFGLDLRLADNPALERAIAQQGAVLPVFMWAPDEESP